MGPLCLPVLSHSCQKRVIACRPSVTHTVLHLGEAWARPAGLETWGGSCGRKHLSWNRINKTLTEKKQNQTPYLLSIRVEGISSLELPSVGPARKRRAVHR